MSAPARRLTVELPTADNQHVAHVGSRPLQHFWPVLAAYFRDVLLPPQRRAGDAAVGWSWSEPASSREPPTAAELATLRKRLRRDQQLLAENLERASEASHAAAGGTHLAGLAETMGQVIERLAAAADSELSGYVCRTEAGWRLHSWGARAPSEPVDADGRTLAVRGVVRVGGKPRQRAEVVLRDAGGRVIARTRTDGQGVFGFSPVAAGEYRVMASCAGREFPAGGVPATVDDEPIAGLLLETDDEARGVSRGWWWAGAGVAALGVALVIALRAARPSRAASAPSAEPQASAETASLRASEAAAEPVARAKPRPPGPQLSPDPHGVTGAGYAGAVSATSATQPMETITTARVSPAISPAVDTRPRVPGSPMGQATAAGTPVAAALPLSGRGAGTPPAAPAASPPSVESKSPREPEGNVTPVRTESTRERAGGETKRGKTKSTRETELGGLGDARLTPASPASSVLEEPEPIAPATRPDAVPPIAAAGDERKPAPAASGPFVFVRELRTGAWRPELLVDAILPTLPVRAGQPSGVAALRDQLLAAVPEALRGRRVDYAVVVRPRALAPAGPWRWRDGAAPGRVEPAGAELIFGEDERAGARHELIDAEGRVLAEWIRAAGRTFVVRAVEEVRVSWACVVTLSPDESGRLAWRGVSGGPLLEGGRETHDAARGELRVEFPSAAGPLVRSFALCDNHTGWGLVGQLAETAPSVEAH